MNRHLEPPYFELVPSQGDSPGPYVFTCEHATDAFGSQPIESENTGLLGTHWAIDIGAAALTRALARSTNSIAVLSTYSRLLLDSNRCLESKTLFVREAESQVIECNRNLSAAEQQYRIECLHAGYHSGVTEVLAKRVAIGPCLLISMHSFTPVFNDHQRSVEIGVLFDDYEGLAHQVINRLSTLGFDARANEPYSGMSGELMYAATLHGNQHRIPYIEFEVRQDLISTPEGIERIMNAINTALESIPMQFEIKP